MEEGKVSDNSLTSAAAFVEGGIQDACDDACSICLEAFCDSDPSTVTSCKHEFHLQCILEWCQRSSQCPMCWQALSLKDPNSQELLDGVEHERNVHMNPPRNSTIFHHPTLGEFELQHLPVNPTESELEERIIQHLAAAATMGRARQIARREGQRNRSSTQGRPHFLVFSTQSNGASAASPPSDSGFTDPNSPLVTVAQDSSQIIVQPSSLGPSAAANQHETSSSNRRSPAQTSPGRQDRAGPSDLQSFSENLKTRLSSLSTRYKESITKSTRGWKERIFARNTEMPPSARESSRSIATVSQMMDHLEIAEDGSRNVENGLTTNVTEEHHQTGETGPLGEDGNRRSPCAAAASSASN
ncbi:hypothetical protein CASFOL_029202 [Castilleja foliolosa]|uniref:RING-type E3 ubiquitin transferase n=1 Tax=Castilleja foliolosa TaxID=1961234 RepID=A0ABD3CCB1_9LAMI